MFYSRGESHWTKLAFPKEKKFFLWIFEAEITLQKSTCVVALVPVWGQGKALIDIYRAANIRIE